MMGDYVDYVYGEDWEWDMNGRIISRQYSEEEVEKRKYDYVKLYGYGRCYEGK